MVKFPDLQFIQVPPHKKDPKRANFDLKLDTINIVRKGERSISYSKAWSQDQINEWIFHSLNPPITKLDDSYLDLIKNHQNPAFLLIVRINNGNLILNYLELQ